MWAGATRRPRLALLATMVDVVAGHVPDGPVTPTLDLRIQTTGEVPSEGAIRLIARPWRVGRRFIVSETLLEDEAGRIFARGTTTFLNQPIRAQAFRDSKPPRSRIDSFDRHVGAKIVDARTLELAPSDRVANVRIGTVQGGVQAMLAELAAEHVANGPFAAVDLDIRYLRRVEVGPLRAIATPTGRVGSLDAFRVELIDVGSEGRRVAAVSILSSA